MEQKIRYPSPYARLIALICLLLPLSGNLPAANLTEEQRVSRQLDGPGLQGSALWLNAASGKFLSLLSNASGTERVGGVILLHDVGAHADWHAVIAPLRASLSQQGWDVLALQMPVLSNKSGKVPDNFWQETRNRIQAAVDYFSSQENNNLALIGQGLGAQAALDYLSAQASPRIRALVTIGLGVETVSGDRFLKAIEELTGPMLDIYGSQDHAAVTASAGQRLSAGKKNRQGSYRQDRVMGADHYFHGLESSLQRRIDAWLKRVVQDRQGDARQE